MNTKPTPPLSPLGSPSCSASSEGKRRVDQSWFNAKSVEYNTPDNIYDPLHKEFGFTLDVASTDENAKCANHFTLDDDGLKQPWSGVAWMNPPYGRVMQKWIRKAHAESKRGVTVVALIPARTNTVWWHDCIQGIAEVRFIRGQVAFKGFDRGLWMPMCIIIWQNVKEHALLSAGAHVDHGVAVETTGVHENKAADRGCVSRLVLASSLREFGNDLYDAYVTESFSSQYERIAGEIINKLNQSGIQIVAKEGRGDLPKSQKQDQTTSTDQ